MYVLKDCNITDEAGRVGPLDKRSPVSILITTNNNNNIVLSSKLIWTFFDTLNIQSLIPQPQHLSAELSGLGHLTLWLNPYSRNECDWPATQESKAKHSK